MRIAIALLIIFSVSIKVFAQDVSLENDAPSLKSQKASIKEAASDVDKVDLLIKLANSYYLQMDFEEQSKTLEEALNLSKQLDNTEKKIESYLLLTELQIEDKLTQDRKKEALREAVKLLSQTDNQSLITQVQERQIELNEGLTPREKLKSYQGLLQLKKAERLSPYELAVSDLEDCKILYLP